MEIPSNLITVVGTLGGAVLGAWIASGRAHKEKLWDLRRQAYGAILSELAMVERILGYADGLIEVNVLMYYGSTTHSSHQDQWVEHLEIAKRRFADEYLALSEKFIALFESFEAETDAEDPNDNVQDEHEKFAQAVKKARALLLAQARAEIAAQRKWRLSFGSRG